MVEGKRLFLFDLDGTLLRSDKTISKKTLAEVSKLRDKSNIIGMAIFFFMVDKRTFVRYNKNIERMFFWRPRICQN